MKKIIALLATAGIYRALGGKKAEAWFSDTHSDITEKAVALLEKEGKIKPYNFYKNYLPQLVSGSVAPDGENDCDKALGAHYYSCSNGKGKDLSETNGYYKNRLGKFSKSARTMLEENYTSALCLYKSGETEKAMTVLGRAIHFVCDMSCTVHTANMKYVEKSTNAHYAFEKHVNTVCRQYSAEKLDKRLSKSYDGDSFGAGLNKLVKSVSRFAESVARLDPKAFDEAAKSSLPAAQQNTAALLLKFFDDCSSDKGNFICGGRKYTFKNEATGQLLTFTNKGLSAEAPDKELEQKLELHISDMGTFGFKVSEGGFVSENCKSFDYPKIGTLPAQFRFAALGKRRFRITTGGTNFEKVIACTKSGNLTITEFEPGDPTQVWIIN